MNSSIEKLRENGYKITPKIKVILELFDGVEEYMSVSEIQKRLKRKHHEFGLPTIYRILERLEQSGIVLTFRTEDRQIYYFQCRSGNTSVHHHHFICRKCRKVKEIGVCAFSSIQRYIENSLDALVQTHQMHVEGLCSECK